MQSMDISIRNPFNAQLAEKIMIDAIVAEIESADSEGVSAWFW